MKDITNDLLKPADRTMPLFSVTLFDIHLSKKALKMLGFSGNGPWAIRAYYNESDKTFYLEKSAGGLVVRPNQGGGTIYNRNFAEYVLNTYGAKTRVSGFLGQPTDGRFPMIVLNKDVRYKRKLHVKI